FFFQAEDGIRDFHVTGVQTCALPISAHTRHRRGGDLPGRVTDALAAFPGERHAGLPVDARPGAGDGDRPHLPGDLRAGGVVRTDRHIALRIWSDQRRGAVPDLAGPARVPAWYARRRL